MPATVIVAITAVAASTGAVDAIEVESLVGDWGFEVGAKKIYFRLSPPPEQWMQKRLHLWLEIGDLKSLGAPLWELIAVAHIIVKLLNATLFLRPVTIRLLPSERFSRNEIWTESENEKVIVKKKGLIS